MLHGSSGLSDDQFRKLIAHGIAKVNYFTALSDLSAQQIATNARSNNAGYPALFSGVRERVVQEMERLMRVWGSAGRAAEVLAQCRPWQGVEHHICFSLADADAAEVALIMERGAKALRRISGVRQVVSGVMQVEGSAPRHCWHLQLVTAAVVEQLRSDGEFQAFAKRYLEGYARQIEQVTLIEQPSGMPGV